jgi:hypothetical protein
MLRLHSGARRDPPDRTEAWMAPVSTPSTPLHHVHQIPRPEGCRRAVLRVLDQWGNLRVRKTSEGAGNRIRPEQRHHQIRSLWNSPDREGLSEIFSVGL